MYTLYCSPGVCSMSVHVALEELGAEFDTCKVDLSKGEHQQPEYLAINPRGQVGALKTEDGIFSENAAMIIYLDDKHGNKLIPAEGGARLKALQWLMCANSTLHPTYAKCMFALRNEGTEEQLKAACDGVQEQWDLIEKQLTESGDPYLCGENFTAGDIYVAVVANWQFIPHLPTFGPKTKAFLKAVTERPSYQRAIATEEIEYKALVA